MSPSQRIGCKAKPTHADGTTLSTAQAQRVYDRIGRAQDTQAFYEDRAIAELIPHLRLRTAHSIFEFGCGTGRFAARLLSNHLPGDAAYRAIDLSPVMVALAQRKLALFGSRVKVVLSDGAAPTREPLQHYDRFFSNFVLDLLPYEEIAAVLREAHRMLRPGGMLALASLTTGFTPGSRAFVRLWRRIHAFRPGLVGGCRPLELLEFLPETRWRVVHHARVVRLGIPLEAVVAERVGIAAR